MNQYYMLMKNNMIDFDKIMIDKYCQLNLSEVDAIILIKLNNLLKNGKRVLDAEDLAPYMSITKNQLIDRIVNLVSDGYITLTLSALDSRESFSLDETYKRLSNLLIENNFSLNNDNVKEVVDFIEKEFKKIVSPIELDMINHWINHDNFSISKIREAVLECLKQKKHNIQYVDVILNKKTVITEQKNSENLQNLFNNVYGKSK